MTDPEPSPFFQHLNSLMKKKLLMQFRDKKTLGVDLVFPIILIISGLWLATIAIFRAGITRSLQPYDLYPSNPIYYNLKSGV